MLSSTKGNIQGVYYWSSMPGFMMLINVACPPIKLVRGWAAGFNSKQRPAFPFEWAEEMIGRVDPLGEVIQSVRLAHLSELSARFDQERQEFA